MKRQNEREQIEKIIRELKKKRTKKAKSAIMYLERAKLYLN